jgi:probable O-glycosylation ligase (exosortase A-associated)
MVAFTFILLIAPQWTFPALKEIRPALTSSLISVIALLVYRFSHHRQLFVMTREMWIAGALLTWSIVTVPWSYWPGGSVSFLLAVYVKSLVIFWLLVNTLTTPRRIRRIVWTLTILSTPLALAGIRHFVSGDFYQRGKQFKRILGYGAPLTTNPNDLALVLNLLLPLTIALLLITKGPFIRLALVGVITLNVIGIFATYSRGGFVTLAVIFMSYVWKFRARRERRYTWGIVMCLVLLVLVGLPFLPASYVERLSTIADIRADKTGSAEERWSDLVTALNMAANNPFVGAGIAQNILALNEERGKSWREIHNVYLQLTLDLGLPGLLLFVALLWLVFKAVLFVQRETADEPDFRDLFYLAEGVNVSLVAFMVAAMFHPIAYNFGFYYMAGLALALRQTWLVYKGTSWASADPIVAANR